MTFTIAAGFYIAGFFGGMVTLALFNYHHYRDKDK